jgi:hypothetical protein
LGPEHPDTLNGMISLGVILAGDGNSPMRRRCIARPCAFRAVF